MVVTLAEPGANPADEPARVQAMVLGGFEVRVGDRTLTHADWQRVSAERLFKLLAVTPGHRVLRGVAAETLWPGSPPSMGGPALRKALHFANRALGAGTITPGTDLLRLDPVRLDLDLDRLERAYAVLAPARTAHGHGLPPAVDEALELVLDLGSRDLLPDDPYEDWLLAPRERLRARWEQVALPAAGSALDAGRPDRALAVVERLIEREPADEAAHRLAIRIYGAEGRHHAARRQFELCRRALRELLDAEPSPETVETFEAVEALAPASRRARAPRLVGRQVELERIEPVLDRTARGRAASLVIRGPAGIGKSRLLEEVVSYARAAGWRTLEWQATGSSRSLAYAPLRAIPALDLTVEQVRTWGEPERSAARTLRPDLGPPALTFADAEALDVAICGLVARLAEERPLMIAIDDLGGLDDATLRVLAGVGAVGGSHVLVGGTIRDDEDVPHRVSALIARARRPGGLDLELGPLGRRDIERLVLEHLGGGSVADRLTDRLFEATAGNPLYCLELARIGRDRGSIRQVAGRWTIATERAAPAVVPPSARDIVADRLATLSSSARNLLGIIAELGPTVPYRELAAVVGTDRSVIDDLDAALASGLLVERGAGYAFGHPLHRLAVKSSAGIARRADICAGIAVGLAGVAADAPPDDLLRAAGAGPDPVAVARYALTAIELGRTDLAPLGVAFGFRAGEASRRLFDRPLATEMYEGALAAWAVLPADAPRAFPASAVYVALGELRDVAGDEAGATAAFRQAMTIARTPEELATAYGTLYWLPYHHGDFEACLTVLGEGMARLPQDADVARAELERDTGWCLVRLDRYDEALPLLGHSVEVMEAAADRRGAMQSLDLHGDLLGLLGRYDEAIAELERSLTLALELGDSRGELLAHLHLGGALTRGARPQPARPHFARALEVARWTGDRYGESVAAWLASEMEDALGNLPAAAELRRRELDLLRGLGGNPHNEALSHAHLATIARRLGETAAAEREAAEARALAARSGDATYPERIDAAIGVARWADVKY